MLLLLLLQLCNSALELFLLRSQRGLLLFKRLLQCIQSLEVGGSSDDAGTQGRSLIHPLLLSLPHRSIETTPHTKERLQHSQANTHPFSAVHGRHLGIKLSHACVQRGGIDRQLLLTGTDSALSSEQCLVSTSVLGVSCITLLCQLLNDGYRKTSV